MDGPQTGVRESVCRGTYPAAILDRLPTSVLVLDAQGAVRYANESAMATLSLAPEQLIGRAGPEVLGDAVSPLGIRDGEERIIRTPNGRARRISVESAAFEDESIIVFRDISQLARLRAQRDKLMGLAAIGEALPSLLHELKNPLAAVTTAVEVLIDELDEGAGVQDYLYAILSELRRMNLGFQGIGAVHGELRSPRTHVIDQACTRAALVLEARAANAQVRFRYVIRELPLLPFDPSVVRAILLNFVTNAIHACEPGSSVRVEVGLIDDDRALRISVSDTGAGMTPDVLEHATELFFTTKHSGSGIGLALCRRAIEGAGGELELRSVPGFGTVVEARIPIEATEE